MSVKASELRVRSTHEKLLIRKSLSLLLKKKLTMKDEFVAIQVYQKLKTK